MLRNIYPHFTLDLWFEKIQSTVPGRGILGALRIFDVASVFVDSYGPFGDLFVHLLEDVPTNPSSCNSDTHESLRAEKLQKNRRVVGRPACRCGLDAFEAEIRQIERVDKGIHHTNGIALLDPFIKAFRHQL